MVKSIFADRYRCGTLINFLGCVRLIPRVRFNTSFHPLSVAPWCAWFWWCRTSELIPARANTRSLTFGGIYALEPDHKFPFGQSAEEISSKAGRKSHLCTRRSKLPHILLESDKIFAQANAKTSRRIKEQSKIQVTSTKSIFHVLSAIRVRIRFAASGIYIKVRKYRKCCAQI